MVQGYTEKGFVVKVFSMKGVYRMLDVMSKKDFVTEVMGVVPPICLGVY